MSVSVTRIAGQFISSALLALKDPVARAWLLTDAVRGSVFAEAKTGDVIPSSPI